MTPASSTAQSPTLASRVVVVVVASSLLLLLVSLGGLKGVDGLASKNTLYHDDACELDSGTVALIFGFPALDGSGGVGEIVLVDHRSRGCMCDFRSFKLV